jgi:hypothetical protein
MLIVRLLSPLLMCVQEGEYVTSLDADGFSMGEHYPSHYYTFTNVCQRCFRVWAH